MPNGNVDQLNFEVILRDERFDKQIKKDLEMARRLNSDLSSILNLKKRLNSETTAQIVNAEKVAQAEQRTAAATAKAAAEQSKAQRETAKTAQAQKQVTSEVRKTHSSLTSAAGIMRTLSALTGVTFGAVGVRRFLSSMIEITGQFEMQQVALRTMLRDAEAADRLFEQLYQFSSASTYRFSELAKYAKQIAAFGIGEDKLLETTKMIGDVASGLGVSMDRLILAYGHVKSSGFLRGIQLRSFSQNGVPILQELSKMFTEIEGKAVSLGDVFDKMTRREITFEMVEEAFRRMTSEGGQFYNMQENLANTLAGQINIMKGRWENLMYEMGQQTSGVVMTIVKAISNSISSLDKFKESLKSLFLLGSPILGLFELFGKGKNTGDIGNSGGGTSGGRSEAVSEGDAGFIGPVIDRKNIKKDIQNLYDVSSIVKEIKSDERDIAEIRRKMVSGGITEDEKKRYDTLKSSIDDNLKLYKDLMGVDYHRATTSAVKSSDSDRKKQIDGTKKEIALLEKYKDAYDKLQPYFGDETQSQMEKIFGAGDYTAIDSQIDALVADLRKLGKAGDEAADAIEARLGTDAVSKVLKAQKALETQQKKVDKWQNTLRKWEKDWGGNYSGFNSDLDNIVSGYNDESKKIDDEYADALKEIKEAHEGNAEAIWEETQKLKKLYEARKSSALNEAQNKLNESAKKYVKDATSRMSLTDWGDKSIGQVYRIWRDLSRMADESSIENVDGQLKQRVYKAGLLFKDFRELTKEEFDKLEKEAQEELLKKAGQSIKEFASLFGDLAGQITEFANASGNDGLARVASDLSDAVSVASDAIAKVLEGDYVGAILTEVTSVANEFFKAATAAAELKRTIRETAEEARRQRFTENLTTGVSNIFGTNDMASLRNAMSNINSLRSLTASDRRNAAGEFQTKAGAKWYDWLSKGANIFSLANGFAKGRSQYDSMAGMASNLGMDLLDEYGNLNANTLQAILDTYSDLRQADKEWIQQAINNSEAYAEAMRQVDDVISSIFDNVGQSATDAIVDGWISAGNAALNYADILDDVAQSYAKMVVKSMIMDEVLNDEAVKAVKNAFMGGDSAEAMSLIEGDLQRIADLEPVFQQVLETFDPYFSKEGGSSDNTLQSGISKELVEKNSSLLASYINAMRADLSVVRQMQASGWMDVKAIREAVQGSASPNYNEYMAQIAANTYDMARSNDEILSRLRSVITASPSGGSAIRTAR